MIDVFIGPCAIAVKENGRTLWVGVASGNIYSGKYRRTAEKALQDAIEIERKALKYAEEVSDGCQVPSET